MSIKKLVLTLFSGGIGGTAGYYFGRALHDLILAMGIYNFQNYSWFNTTQYLNLYYKYSSGLDNLLGFVFAMLGLGIGGLLGYKLGEAVEYKDRRYGIY